MKKSVKPSFRRKCTRSRSDLTRTSPTLERNIRSDLSSLFNELRGETQVSATDRFKYSYLEKEIFSKFLDPACKTGAEGRKTAAISKWRAAELRNAKTNVRLYVDVAEFTIRGRTVTSDMILSRARDTVARVLCETPPEDVLYGTFTSGASTLFPRGDGVIAQKFMDEAHVTPSAKSHILHMRDVCDGWREISDSCRGETLAIETVEGNVMFTVPKTSEIDRCAAKEPGLNMFCQKGIGDYIRHRLRSVLRVDLNDQTRNQRLARKGSIDGSLATIDLSSASDTISEQLVFRLLPLDWFHLLNDVRSKYCYVDGEVVELNMFSSMGNAFTFELETLIFWSLTNAIAYFAGVRGTISVYGDDIICPSAIAGLLARVFAFMGFKVNPKKSHWRGPFRESCGKHWYKGIDVTPFYVREPIRDLPRLIHFCNRLRLWAGQSGRLDERISSIWMKYARRVPRRFRGGSDLQSIYQVVSYETPVARLLPLRRKVSGVNMAGAYLHWLRAADSRQPAEWVSCSWRHGHVVVTVRDPLVTSDVESEKPFYKAAMADAYSTGMELALRFVEEHGIEQSHSMEPTLKS